jgi:hypothetical protein
MKNKKKSEAGADNIYQPTKANDEKESPLARTQRVTSSFSLAGIAAFMTVSVLDT